MYSTIHTLDEKIHVGWNSHFVDVSQVAVQYVRLSHTMKSACQLAEFQVWGSIYSNVGAIASLASFPTDVTFDDSTVTPATVWPVKLTFESASTPVVDTVANAAGKSNGDVYGGYDITLTGTFPAGTDYEITIDGIDCPVSGSPTTTSIVCTVGQRLALPESNYFLVVVDNKKAVLKEEFIYVMRWSDPRTWGLDVPPVDDDYVFVPKGMTLYVDQSTPKLLGITCEDSHIIFADETDMEIHAGFIHVVRGTFTAGTEEKPYTKKLTFTMYGDYYGRQQPTVGNKGISILEGKLSMHGKKIDTTWTNLAATAIKGATSIQLKDSPVWAVGDSIVIASTDYDYDQAEVREIKTIVGDTITFDKPLLYQHLGVEETYGTHKLVMRAEVGLLTRNIKMQGDETSWENNYGSHLMMVGSSTKGLVGQIAYTEFTHCGQPRIVGRYCMHFHMNGDVEESFVRGNSVHDSMARILTIHGVHYLTVEHNVGYNVHGHNFFLEDGIETNNVIQYNLAIKSMESNMMMATDTSTASYWITNPLNIVRYNVAAGGNFYGFWYEIKPHPDGPSARVDICPTGMPLGESHDNVAHSNKRFGIRLFRYSPLKFPCSAYDPDTNPSVGATFYNYMLYKNEEVGLLAERNGNLVFDNFTIADNRCGGMEFWKADLTNEYTIAKNSVIIGLSANNPDRTTTAQFKCPTFRKVFKGIETPRSDGLLVQNVGFYNIVDQMNMIWTCAECDNACVFINSARESVWENIHVDASVTTSRKLRMLGHKKEIIYNPDGSLFNTAGFDAKNRSSATLTNAWPHILQETGCVQAPIAAEWGGAAVCDETVIIRRVLVGDIQKAAEFDKVNMKVIQVDDGQFTVGKEGNVTDGDYSDIVSYLGSL